jgi:integrase
VRLKYADYRPEERTLYIEKTKFNKDRLIPVPKRAASELENFISVRNAVIDENGNHHLLATDDAAGIHNGQIYTAFHRAVRNIGLHQPVRVIANTTFGNPRPHSLRHSFAVNTLKAVRDRGGSPQNALPILAAYLGHTDYRYTMKYLKVLDAQHRQALVDFSVTRGKRERL